MHYNLMHAYVYVIHKNALYYSACLCITYTAGSEYYTIIDFNEVDIRIHLPKKVIIHRGR